MVSTLPTCTSISKKQSKRSRVQYQKYQNWFAQTQLHAQCSKLKIITTRFRPSESIILRSTQEYHPFPLSSIPSSSPARRSVPSSHTHSLKEGSLSTTPSNRSLKQAGRSCLSFSSLILSFALSSNSQNSNAWLGS